jgi:8-hydroxy-5-deazaflavin:NADPH oxidoreductase
VEQLIRDAGYDPMYAGGLDKASTQEQGIGLFFALSQASGPFFYRMAAPGEL